MTKTASFRLQFIDGTRFMVSLLSNFVNNFAEGIHGIKCKLMQKKCANSGIKDKDSLEDARILDGLIEQKCLCCNKNYQKKFDENLKMQFVNTYKYSNHDISKFILLFLEDV